ncbi:integral membrane protein, YccS/YhfK family [Roseibium album]|nr:integral membrane protein, YccS/YhfK family [Roseibium album]
MFQLVTSSFNRFLNYDPGALRLVRGIDLMLTVVCAAVIAHYLVLLQPGVSAFKMSILAAAAAAHCLLFTPVSTRRLEAANILRLGLIIVMLFSFGAVVAKFAGSSPSSTLQVIWVAIITFGFLLDGLSPFWERAGRMIAICWLFVIMTSEPQVPGLWLPAMGAIGMVIAFAIRIGLWRPSQERTFLRVENATRRAMADYLQASVGNTSFAAGDADKALSKLVDLRKELRLCAELLNPDGSVHGLSPEAATMMQLALEVVRDALSEVSTEARTRLVEGAEFRNTVQQVEDGLLNGHRSDASKPDLSWSTRVTDLSRNDRFHIMRAAQAFKRLWLHCAGNEPLPAFVEKDADKSAAKWWQLLSWRLALQACVAAGIAYGVGVYFELNHAYWVTLTVIVVLCSNLGTTVQKTLQRTIGTVVGVFVAMGLGLVLSGYPLVGVVIATLAIPVTIVFIDRNYAIAAGFISFMVVIGLHALAGLPVSELWSRLYDTVIGGGVGLSVAWILFPTRTDKRLSGLTKAYLNSCEDYLKAAARPEVEDKRTYADLRRRAGRLVATAKVYRMERALWSSFSGSSDGLDVLVSVLADYIVLYRQARASVLTSKRIQAAKPQISPVVAKMDERVLSEFEAVLQGKKGQPVPGLADEWLAALPAPAANEPDLMADWVAMLYYARKVIRCLDGFRQDATWLGAFEPELS